MAAFEEWQKAILFRRLEEHREHPYPTQNQKQELALAANLSFIQVTTWMNHARELRVPRISRERVLLEELEVVEIEVFEQDNIEQVLSLALPTTNVMSLLLSVRKSSAS